MAHSTPKGMGRVPHGTRCGTILSVPTWTLSEIEAAVRSSWGPDTVFASADYMARGSGQPSRGQCGTTALVIQNLLGGDLMVADVEYEGGWRVCTTGTSRPAGSNSI
jgi:hypothetical protein